MTKHNIPEIFKRDLLAAGLDPSQYLSEGAQVVQEGICKKALAVLAESADAYAKKADAEEPHSWPRGYYQGVSDGIRYARLVIGLALGSHWGAAKLGKDNLKEE